jgi:ribokinase
MGRVTVLGSANMDLVVRQPRRPEPGETIFGTEFSTGPGGKGLNQAVAAARAGANVAFAAAVGDDEFGRRLRARLVADGVDTSLVRTVGAATGIAQISVTDDGENTIVVVPGANATADLTDAERAIVSDSSHLVVQLERPVPLLREAMRHARSTGVVTVLTPAPVQPDLAELLALSDVIIPNEGEAMFLAREDDAEAAAIVLSRTVPTVIVTLGARGAIVASGGEVIRRVAPRRVEPVDTTGAGDCGLDAALDAATAAASLAVGRPGAADSMPFADEIEALLP